MLTEVRAKRSRDHIIRQTLRLAFTPPPSVDFLDKSLVGIHMAVKRPSFTRTHSTVITTALWHDIYCAICLSSPFAHAKPRRPITPRPARRIDSVYMYTLADNWSSGDRSWSPTGDWAYDPESVDPNTRLLCTLFFFLCPAVQTQCSGVMTTFIRRKYTVDTLTLLVS